MRKLITLLAVATLATSPFAFAEEQAGNPNDVLQSVPGQQANGSGANNTNNNLTVADNEAAPVAPEEHAADQAAAEAKPVKKTHHPRHHKKHHYKKHHPKHSAKKAAAPKEETNAGTTESATAPTEAPSQPAAGTETQAPAQ